MSAILSAAPATAGQFLPDEFARVDDKQCARTDRAVAHAREIRGAVGLRSSLAVTEDSFADPSYHCTAFGVPLSDDEAQEFIAVLNAQAELSDKVSTLDDDPTYTGAYLDGATLVVSSTNGTLGSGIEHRQGVIETLKVSNSWADLQKTADTIVAGLRQAEKADVDINLVKIDPRLNRVRVGVMDERSAAADYLAERYGDMVVVKKVSPDDVEFLPCTSNACGTKGGLKMTKGRVSCTTGFIMRARPSDGNWNHYILTAGHCVDSTGGTGSNTSWTNGDGTITWGKNKAQDFWDTGGCGWLNDCWTNDLGVVGLGNVDPADLNEYFLTTDLHVPITDRTTKGNQLIGQVVFRRGITSGLDSGVIADKPEAWSDPKGVISGSNIFYNTIKVNLRSDHGDSGAGFYRVSTQGTFTVRSAYGILSAGNDTVTVYYAWNQPLYWTTAVCDPWVIQPCTTTGCPLT